MATDLTPGDWPQALLSTSTALQRTMDEAVLDWKNAYEGSGGKIYCRRGCGNCCRLAVHATFPEALVIARALSASQAEALERYAQALRSHLYGVEHPAAYLRAHRRNAGFCPFLGSQGECGIYAVRPFACRALLSTRNPDYCGIDLSALHPLEQKAFLSSLDPAVVAFPTHYAAAPQASGRALELQLLERMSRVFGFSLGGNLALLVWLIRERGLEEAVGEGKEAVAALLRAERLALPFVLDLQGG